MAISSAPRGLGTGPLPHAPGAPHNARAKGRQNTKDPARGEGAGRRVGLQRLGVGGGPASVLVQTGVGVLLGPQFEASTRGQQPSSAAMVSTTTPDVCADPGKSGPALLTLPIQPEPCTQP